MAAGLDKKKIALLEKMVSFGIDTTKKIQTLGSDGICDFLEEYGMKVPDFREILNMQKDVRKADILEYLKEKPIVKKEETDETGKNDRGTQRPETPGRNDAGWNNSQH